MKIAFFSDMRGDLYALEAVLRDMQEQGCTTQVCLGDIVGTGTEPAACVSTVRGLNCSVVPGECEDWLAGSASSASRPMQSGMFATCRSRSGI